MNLTTALGAVFLIASQAEQAYESELKQVVAESNACLMREVNSRLDDGKTEITDQERSQIRIAAANACYEDAERLARLSSNVRNGSESLKEVTQSMLADSLRLANAYIGVRLKANADKANK